LPATNIQDRFALFDLAGCPAPPEEMSGVVSIHGPPVASGLELSFVEAPGLPDAFTSLRLGVTHKCTKIIS